MGIIDDVKQKIDIVEVIGQHSTLKKAGRNLTALCPFHSEKHASFFVYPEQQSWHCFGACNTGGDVFSFIMKKEGIGFGDALRLLADKAGVTIPSRFEREEGKEEKEKLFQINEDTVQYFHNILLNSSTAEKARSYVTNRGFLPKSTTDFQLGFSLKSWESLKQHLLERGHDESLLLTAGLLVPSEDGKTHDRFRNRLMFPIRDSQGHTLGFGARSIDDSMPKYINSPQTPLFDKSRILYGIDIAAQAIKQQDMAVIVEGYIDAITAHQNGVNNVLASMGTSITEKQVSTIKKLTRNLVLALDSDTAGEEAMLRGISHENTLNAEIKVVILPQGKDPDDVIREDAKIWQQLVEESLPIVDFTFQIVTSKLNLSTARDKSLAVERLLTVVAEIKDPIRQTHYLQKLGQITDVPVRTLETSLSRMKTRLGANRTKEPAYTTEKRSLRPDLSNPVEEYCLALLLQHPGLKDNIERLLPEYFEQSENREIFLAWQQADDLASLKTNLDTTIHEHLDALISKSLLPNQIEQRYTDYIRNLRLKYLRNRESRRAEMLAREAETGGTGADLSKLEKEGIEPSIQLKEMFDRKNQRRTDSRR